MCVIYESCWGARGVLFSLLHLPIIILVIVVSMCHILHSIQWEKNILSGPPSFCSGLFFFIHSVKQTVIIVEGPKLMILILMRYADRFCVGGEGGAQIYVGTGGREIWCLKVLTVWMFTVSSSKLFQSIIVLGKKEFLYTVDLDGSTMKHWLLFLE